MNNKLLFTLHLLMTVNACGAFSEALLSKAEAGDSSAQVELAVCYRQGDGVAQDEAEVMKWRLLILGFI